MEGLFAQDAPPVVGYVQVALEQGIDVSATGLTYAVPQPMADLAVGERVRVPLGRGNKLVSGYIVERTDDPPVDPAAIKRVAERIGGLSLTPDLITLAKWIAGYYVCPLGMVFSAMLPAAVKHGTGATTRTLVQLADPAPPAEDEPKLTKLQQAVVAVLRDAAEPMEIKALADAAGAKTVSPVKQLLDKGILTAEQVETVVSDLDLRAQREALADDRFTLGRSQQAAVDHLTAHLGRFGVHLLHGVTGSGKTEVYLRAIEALRAEGTKGRRDEGTKGKQDRNDPSCLCPSVPSSLAAPTTIILVPEIALTPQTVARFVQRFTDVAVLHSGLTAAQRHAQWRRIRRGEATVIVGARSAVFAPAPNLQMIIVDEEHESSYKQDQLPRYHARDIAIKRAQLLNIPVVLGSATPSLESWANARGAGIREQGSGAESHSDPIPDPGSLNPGRSPWHLIRIPERVANQQLPKVRIVDLQEERRQRKGIHLLSQALEQALVATLDKGQQAMLLLNRRGYANYIACPDHHCGWMLTCDHCDVTMVYHRDKALPTGGVVRCHHCGAEQLLPAVCPLSSHKVSVFGLGVQKVESEVELKLPGVTKRRMDSDTMRTARDYQDTLDAFGRGDFQVLLGTQMIAKGLDFPNVTLVGVISADTSLHLPDFRAAERTFQLIAQVAGRAGRSDASGQVIVQTFNPDDPTIALAAEHDYDTFADQELAVRQDVGLPPATRMARIVLRDTDPLAVAKRAAELAAALGQFNAHLGDAVRLRGPAPCAIARVADFHRHQIELISGAPAPLQKLLAAARNARILISDNHTAIDVDPISLL